MRVEEPGGPDAVTIDPDQPVYQVNIFLLAPESVGVPGHALSYNVHEWKLHDADVPEVLAWAAAEGRILITNDRNTMVGFAYQRVAAGEPVPGLIATTNEQSIGSAIDDILLVAEYVPEEEIRDQVVVFLPFRG